MQKPQKYITLLKSETIAFQKPVPHFKTVEEFVRWMDEFLIDSGLMTHDDELCVTEDV